MEKNPGMLNSGMPGNSGAGFWFQVFTYRTGSKLQLYCSARFTPVQNGLGRKRRSTEEVEEDHEVSHVIFFAYHCSTLETSNNEIF